MRFLYCRNTHVISSYYFCRVINKYEMVMMEKERAERIVRMTNWVRFIILLLFLTFVIHGILNSE